MLTCTEDFKTAIKADTRECVAKVVLGYSTPLTLEDDKIQSIVIDSSATKTLGAVQNDDIVLTLMENALTEEQFNKQIDVQIFIGCLVNEDYEYIDVGTYMSNGWGKNDKSGIVTINLTSKVNSKADIPQNIISDGTEQLYAYLERFVSIVYGETLIVDSGILQQVIPKAWLYTEDINEQLTYFAMALNGLVRWQNNIEIVPFKKGTATDNIKIGSNESVIETTRITDYSGIFPNVCILRSKFVESVNQKLSSPSPKLGPDEYGTFDISLNCPCYVNAVNFRNELGDISSLTQGITHCVIKVYNRYDDGQKHEIPFDIIGRKIESTLIDEKTDSTVTYIENPYINSSEHIGKLDKSIYSGVCYQIKYRGNPCHQVGDTINVDGIGDLLIYKRMLNYQGYLTGTLEGVLIDG